MCAVMLLTTVIVCFTSGVSSYSQTVELTSLSLSSGETFQPFPDAERYRKWSCMYLHRIVCWKCVVFLFQHRLLGLVHLPAAMPFPFGKSQKSPAENVRSLKENVAYLEKLDPGDSKKCEKVSNDFSSSWLFDIWLLFSALAHDPSH